MKLIIEDDEGRKTVVPIVREEITIGRQDGNTIRLTERNVSRRHARLRKDSGFVLIEDLGSHNGVRVNGDRIDGPTRIKEGDLIEIGDYDLGIQGKFDTPLVAGPSPAGITVPPSQMGGPRAVHRTQPGMPSVAPPVDINPPAFQPPAPVGPAAQPPPPPAAPAPGETAIIRLTDLAKAMPQGEIRDLDKAEMPRLVGLSGPVRGQELYFLRTDVKFGRTEENDLVVDHQSVSRQHCRFTFADGQWKVIDNKSANGVRINGEEYAVSALKAGDTIELGHLKFRFCGPGEKFAAPADKAEEPAAGKGPPSAAVELPAGGPQQRPARPDRRRSKTPILVATVAILAAAGGGGFFFWRNAQSGAERRARQAALHEAEQLAKKREYVAAVEQYEAAGDPGLNAPGYKRALEEKKAQEMYAALERAIPSDPDQAKALLDRCSTAATWWCQKAQEKADRVKQAYAKKHLAAARAAGKPEVCLAEANAVLAFDATSAEARSVLAQCHPQAAEPRAAPRRDPEKAAQLAREAWALINGKDFDGGISKAEAALREKPAEKETLALIYKSLGYGYAFKDNTESAKKYLAKYRPYCKADCGDVDGFLTR